MALETLKELLSLVETDPGSLQEDFDPHGLRYTLEYPAGTRPNIAIENKRIDEVLDGGRFELTALDFDNLPEFLVLSFPGVERVLSQDQLFEIGYEFEEALGLASCEPDLGTDFYIDPVEPSGRATEATRIVSGLCLADPPGPEDRKWALENARITDAWELSRGEGVIIAQPDTGIADHTELAAEHLGLDLSKDILTGKREPIDTLRPGMANPGHGTATGSVAASRVDGIIAGAAPMAKLVPIRCIEDVKVFNAAPVAAAIAYAVSIGADVISMSLGGIPSRAVHAAVKNAIKANLIVVSAAGNCVRTVVWPARYCDVIAVGGTNENDQPWKGSSRGSAVDISAPAEFVYVARRSSPDDTDFSMIEGGQGTSYATALTAGSAALWIAHHGRDVVVAEAERRGISVQKLFKNALKVSARKPDDWDSERYGAGILDAHSLLSLPLASIPGGSVESAQDSEEHTARNFMIEEIGTPEVPHMRYLPELAAIGLRQRQHRATMHDIIVEAKAPGTMVSPSLLDAIASSDDKKLHRLMTSPDGSTSLSFPRSKSAERNFVSTAALRKQGTNLESSGALNSPQALRDYLADGGQAEQMEYVEAALARADQSDPELLENVRSLAQNALGALGGSSRMGIKAQIGLEALVLLIGRPALRVRDNIIDFDDEEVGQWKDALFLAFNDNRLRENIGKIGRIDADNIHWGTGFVVGEDLILTNRHVLQQIAAPIPRRNRPTKWMLTKQNPTIDFSDDPSSQTQATKFNILEAVDAGELDIDPDLIDFAKVDAAVLRVEQRNQAGTDLPGRISLVKSITATDPGQDALLIGYPARPTQLPRSMGNQVDIAILDRLQELYGSEYGRKYLSIGKITKRDGIVHFHDLTTLGGCSGSPVLRTDLRPDVIGLHFGGEWRTENYAHDLPSLRASGQIPFTAMFDWVN